MSVANCYVSVTCRTKNGTVAARAHTVKNAANGNARQVSGVAHVPELVFGGGCITEIARRKARESLRDRVKEMKTAAPGRYETDMGLRQPRLKSNLEPQPA